MDPPRVKAPPRKVVGLAGRLAFRVNDLLPGHKRGRADLSIVLDAAKLDTVVEDFENDKIRDGFEFALELSRDRECSFVQRAVGIVENLS